MSRRSFRERSQDTSNPQPCVPSFPFCLLPPTTKCPMTDSNRNVRKFIDLVRQISGKWANWDPPIPVKVGDYGELDGNGELVVEGNIYDPEFQKDLDDSNIKLDLGAHPAELGEAEQDYIVASTGVKKKELTVNQGVQIPGIASASIKGTWQFQRGKRGALIILHTPRTKFIPKFVQTKILEVERLKDKRVVMSALACPAYLLYLSDKSGENVSIAFSANVPVADALNSEVGFGWWTNNESALLRRASSKTGEHRFTPLFSLRQRAKRGQWFSGNWRGDEVTDASGEYIWQDVYQPWKPLDEDGEEDK
ncbi:hypothetical protein JVU11DRAFT_7331 [Chiua virens]|nr:hypothetical protein JVU11DRAFT_7331 [Chiua virens]